MRYKNISIIPSRSKIYMIIAGIVAAAGLAIGLSLALTGGSSAAAIAPTPTTIGVGGISVGGPK